MITDRDRCHQLARLQARVQHDEALVHRRSFWKEIRPTTAERELAENVCAVARQHGLQFTPGQVEVRWASNLIESRRNGECDWKGLPIICWIQTGLSRLETARIILHELVHAHDALTDPWYDERGYDYQETRCDQVAGHILLASGWVVPT